ncbi:MAG: hypothetical protein GY953_31560, partial [bacterium]|nr:hypothetical protein [bacterium]
MKHRNGRWLYPLLGVTSLAGYVAASLLVKSDHSSEDFFLFLGLFGGLSALWGVTLYRARNHPPRLVSVLVFAALFRLALLPAGFDADGGGWQRVILYDDDVWRYLWEGHVWTAGVNPLEVPP